MTKHNFLVNSIEELLNVIPRAFALALSGRPGPVLVDIPKDIQNQRIEITHWPAPGQAAPLPTPPVDLIEQAAALINTAKRPILYLGGGVIHSGAAPLAKALAEKSALPTVMTLMALGALPIDHPLSLGMLGMHGARHTNLAMHECDLLIAVGARFDDRATGKVAAFCPEAAIIHIDIDPSEQGKIKSAAIGLVGDVSAVLTRLLPQINTDQRLVWQAHIAELKTQNPVQRLGIGDLSTPYGLIDAVAGCVDDSVTIVTDVGQHQMWVAQAYPFRRPRQWLTSGGLGTMGFGLPAAIGAALAEPERTVICFSGDGSILMNIQELATAAEENLNIKLVLLNNASLGLVVQQQTLFYGERVFASKFKKTPDFIRIAEGFGWTSLDLAQVENPQKALHAALHSQGPVFIHAMIEASEQVLPMVAPGAANTDMIGE